MKLETCTIFTVFIGTFYWSLIAHKHQNIKTRLLRVSVKYATTVKEERQPCLR